MFVYFSPHHSTLFRPYLCNVLHKCKWKRIISTLCDRNLVNRNMKNSTNCENTHKYAIYSSRCAVYSRSFSQFRDPSGKGFGSTLFPILAVGALVGAMFSFRWYMNRIPNFSPIPQTNISDSSNSQPNLDTLSNSEIPISTNSSAHMIHKSDEEMTANNANIELSRTITKEKQQNETNEDEAIQSLVYINSEQKVFPTHVSYLIIGAGTAGFAAARSIRASDPTSKVLMVAGGCGSHEAAENGIAETSYLEPPPYLRPPLSKELWNRIPERETKLLCSEGDIRRHSWLYYEAESFFLTPEDLSSVQFGGVGLVRGDPVIRINPEKHTVTLASGRHITYDRCLLATGGRPKRLKKFEICNQTGHNLVDSGHVSYFRNLAEYKRLRDTADKLRQNGGRIAVIGGGFLGSELAISLLANPQIAKHNNSSNHTDEVEKCSSKLSVMHLFREPVPMGNVLPPCLASAVGRFESSKGVGLYESTDVVSLSLVPDLPFESTSNKSTVNTNSQLIRLRIKRNIAGVERIEETDVDHVVFAVGIEPNTDLAEFAGLEIDPINGGFLVNAELEARQGIYAAGDAASYWDPVLGCRRRVEHLNFAEETGVLAGKNMSASLLAGNALSDARAALRYRHQSSMWSSVGSEISWDAVGYIDSQLLATQSFFCSEDKPVLESDVSSESVTDSNSGKLNRGVVFYLTPKERRLVGILLWNMPDEIYSDKEFTAPSRLNLARSLLAERRLIGRDNSNEGKWNHELETSELMELARNFDLYGDIAEDYVKLKTYMENKRLEKENSSDDIKDT